MKERCLALTILLITIPLLHLCAQQARETPPAAARAAERTAETEEQFRLAISSEEYPVTPGDIYRLSYRQGDTPVSVQVMVEGDYGINLGVFGRLNAFDTTFSRLKQTIEERILAGYPRSMPSIIISSLGIFTVQVRGETPDARTVTAWGLARVRDVIRDLASPSASLRNIEVVSRDGKSRRCDLFKAARGGDESENPFVKPGDVVVLYRSERSVEIAGEVFRPGAYELLPGEQLGDLVDLYGGGLTSRADESRLRVQSMSGDTPTVRYVGFSSSKTLPVSDGDVVTIPAKTANLPAVIFEGALLAANAAPGGAAGAAPTEAREEAAPNAPSQYNRIIHPFTAGETLSDALRAVRGSLAPHADLSAAFLVREGNADPLYIDMRGLVTNSASPSDIPLVENDRIVIPPFSSFVTVQGAVFHPGSYPFRAGLPVPYYVGLAGGIDPERNGDGSVSVSDSLGRLRPKGEPPRPGDLVFVPSNAFFYNLNRYAPVITLVATIVGTTITVLAFIQPR
jgi:polysaccharide biosynthesis/export protein